MGLPKLKTKISIEDYLEGEKTSQIKHEYVSGEVYAMAGASDKHHRISANLFKKLDSHLENSECEAFMAEMKLKVNEDTFYYPDVFVACDKPAKSAYQRETPVLIIEVISPSTRQIDRREKLRAYQQMESVQEYLIIEQDKVHIELHRRQPDGRWITYFYNTGDFDEQIRFESVDLTTNLEEIYSRVKFEEQENA
ncbi:MAG: Uma2 family endonuclease [Pyrinomonadaceae bacterium]